MQDATNNANKSADTNLSKLKEIGEALRKQTQAVSHASDQLDNKMGSSSNRLKDQLEEITGSLDDTLKGINSIGETVEQRALNAAHESKLAVHNMSLWSETMDKGVETISNASFKMSQEANEMVSSVKHQTDELTGISKRAKEISGSLKEHVKITGTEDFLKKLSLISESLESVAIDINRVLETRVSDEDWSRFSRGDKSVFIRKILGMRSRSKLVRIYKLHRKDAQFREYVTRYLGQFDGLIANAKRTGQVGVLGAGFMTSDAGKVYMLLKAALEVEPD